MCLQEVCHTVVLLVLIGGLPASTPDRPRCTVGFAGVLRWPTRHPVVQRSHPRLRHIQQRLAECRRRQLVQTGGSIVFL
uniref:Putative processing peptidase beta subunit n=1 Tax=Ixodes ricinus TaxID=34613 RepID=A0A0K8RM18_IXORI